MENEYIFKVRESVEGVRSFKRMEEIVRCRDCEWFGDIGCAIRIVDESDKPKETDFCSFGERREDGKYLR